MELKIKPFGALSAAEIYEILKLRSEVFIVEQKGCYLDPDGTDYGSIHIFLTDPDGSAAGCIRLFKKEDEEGTVQLGRLVVRHRNRGLGRKLMEAAQQEAVKQFHARRLFLTGRRSAAGFYEKCGYRKEVPEGYRENDTPY